MSEWIKTVGDALTEARGVSREEAAARRGERVVELGRLVAVRPGLRHGAVGTYNKWYCRCEPCVSAKREYSARCRL